VGRNSIFESWSLHRLFPPKTRAINICPRFPRCHSSSRLGYSDTRKGGSKKPRKPLGVQEKARTLVELTVAEVRRLLSRMVLGGGPPRWGEVLSWSLWRRHHRAVIRACFSDPFWPGRSRSPKRRAPSLSGRLLRDGRAELARGAVTRPPLATP
jgi:hypothetical protein